MGRPAGSKNKGRSSRSRRGKGEAFTGAKENAVEMRRGGELDLKPVEISSKTFDMHFKAIKSAIERHETTAKLLRDCRKSAKEISKYLPSAIEKMIKVNAKDDMSELAAELHTLGIALKETNQPIQLSIHNTLLGNIQDQAFERGYTNGKAGKAMNDPYPEHSDLSRLFQDGYLKAQAELAGKLGNGGPFPNDHNTRVTEASA